MARHSPLKLTLVLALTICFGVGDSWAKGPPPGKGGGGGGGGKTEKPDHTARQERPAQLGVSGGSTVALANGYCCGGTLGALVENAAGDQFILSNTHVFAGDVVPGGNGQVAEVGDPIIQPGFIDVGCQQNPGDYVANLSSWVALVPGGVTSVDAAIAQVIPGEIDPAGTILEIGAISSETVAAFVNQAVKKSGRTSGLTKGSVSALNATVNVGYENECAGDPFSTTFTNQIIVSSGKFLKSGDSGSVMVEDVTTNPRAVGLLFAGSRRVAVANPIDDVLNAFGVTMVGEIAVASSGTSSDGGSGQSRGIARATQAKEKAADRLMKVPGAVGHAVGLSTRGVPKIVIKVLVDEITPEARGKLPTAVDGVSVELLEVGHIVAY